MHPRLAVFALAAPLLLALLPGCEAFERFTRFTPAVEVGVPIPHDDFVVTGKVRIRPGVYHVQDLGDDGVIHVRGEGTVLDLRGVEIVGHAAGTTPDPDAYSGIAVSIVDAPGAVVLGGTLRGFKVGLRAAGSARLSIDGTDASGNFRQRLRSTVEREDLRDWLRPHDNDDGEWEAKYGAGLSLNDCPDATVRNCTVHGGQNGVLLTRCDRARVFDNDFSFNSGWGIALYRTSDAVVARNHADWCVRGYSHGIYARGQDSAGILVFEQCSRNVFALNSATHGGDGFFLYAGEETLRRSGQGGSNDNLLWKNDFSHAVANAIEATFSSGNRFVGNRLDDSEHGIWAGYSFDTLIKGNTIERCANGISIEHGHGNVIEGNRIADCETGLTLWWDEDAGLADTAFGKTHDLRSFDNDVGPLNAFQSNRIDLVLRDEKSSRVVGNVFGGPRSVMRFEGNVLGVVVGWNPVHEGELVLQAEHEGEVWYAPPSEHAPDLEQHGEGTIRGVGPGGLPGVAAPRALLPFDFDASALPGSHEPALADGAPRGRKFILVDQWGPVDPMQTRLFAGPTSSHAQYSVLGVGGTFEVVSLTAGFVAEPRQGTLPDTIVVRHNGDSSGIHPYQIEVVARGARHRASGSLFAAKWDVRFFRWTIDPRDDQQAWDALLRGDPAERRVLPGIAFDWQGGSAGEAVGSDRFGTLATTEIDLPAGLYDLKTVSDDGIRVWVDGDLVVDDWTHHGPTPHNATLELQGGVHTFRIEHFELTGWSVLNVSLVPR